MHLNELLSYQTAIAVENCGLFAKSPLAVPVLISLLILSQYGGKGAVQSHSGQRRPGFHRKRWVINIKQTKFTVFKTLSRTCFICVMFLHSEASVIMHDIGMAVEYLHNMDIAHRDVKVPLLH